MSDHARTAAVVLAAGKGTRFRSDLAKVLHRAAGRTLVGAVLEALRPLGLGQVVVVVGHQADDVAAAVDAAGIPGLTTALQAEQHGTGHAVQIAMPALADDVERVLILPGDTPLLTADTLQQLLAAADGRAAALLTARLADPTGYGRVLRDPDGAVTGIVEHRDADPRQRAVDEINAGMYVVAREPLTRALGRLDADNDQGELYLTDVIGILAGDGEPVAAVVTDEDEVAGVNDRRQLADAAAVLRRRHLDHLMTDVGVSVTDPATTYVDVDVEVGRDAVLLPGTILEAGTRVGERAVVGPHTHLTGCEVGADATVHSTRGSDAIIGMGATVGPYTHLRPGTRLGVKSKAGAFVETKNADIGDGAKVPHLAYLGDATVGERANIACGVITVNYDGVGKHHTTIEDGAFVGCDTMLVAPVTVGAGAFVAAGSTLTDDVPADALAIARARQVNKEGWAARRREQHDG
ncbi:bifunctional UDP-N-acetylglucosamine diphosphorylase/glucosamine-1-phosphate N-acetyltransferase GlmU [Egicoccus halophilus]|uniref:Bifunctional protein GlmU n=1 Tax=Egicoccus halophilus TaxID=1670830 RepID=A0A8J3ACI8_9ACTN|nr:bifunctional UDP-N-acetylglucosamine diphosphorylase/glucosamine-1-phosphate N-acetyltransferase GlmU [Egicoccus halophilus]GGI03709.1 bifunctional protein GlmU [Egicoccus halophilus]